MNSDTISCPVDHVSVNENRARFTAFLVLLLAIVFVLTNYWLIPAFLLADFALRGFYLNQYSPLSAASGLLIKWFRIGNKPTDRAPKRFAALLGLVFIAAILILIFAGQPVAVLALAGVLIVFATLESFFGFCAGCHVYSLLKKVGLIR